MKRVAAVDCGTNSLRLLVAEVDSESGASRDLERRSTIVRLGQDVDRTGVFADEALRRTFAAVQELAELVASYDVDAVRCVATSAARDVANREEFLEGMRSRLGVTPDIISGDEEARLSYRGATAALIEKDWVELPVLVVDIGGGSTELVTRSGESGPVVAQSLEVGSVRLTERHLHDDPPSPEQINSLVADVDSALDTVGLDFDAVGTLIGVAGTVTTMAAMALELPSVESDELDLARLPVSELLAAIDQIVGMTVEERRALPFMHPGRADVIGAGALVLGCVVRRVRPPQVVASMHDLLDGIAWSLA